MSRCPVDNCTIKTCHICGRTFKSHSRLMWHARWMGLKSDPVHIDYIRAIREQSKMNSPYAEAVERADKLAERLCYFVAAFDATPAHHPRDKYREVQVTTAEVEDARALLAEPKP